MDEDDDDDYNDAYDGAERAFEHTVLSWNVCW